MQPSNQSLSDLPSEEEVSWALFRLLTQNPKGTTPRRAYELLADDFGLRSSDVQAKMDSETRERHWHNRVRWARNDLRKKGFLDTSAGHGVWRLSPHGLEMAKTGLSLASLI